jgi:hypothetical protein
MNLNEYDEMDLESGIEICAVCEKPTRYQDGFSHLKVYDEMVPLCCPLCFEAFRRNPKPYLARLRIRNYQKS